MILFIARFKVSDKGLTGWLAAVLASLLASESIGTRSKFVEATLKRVHRETTATRRRGAS